MSIFLKSNINYGQPVNWSAPLNKNLVGWWMTLPQRHSGARFIDLAGKNHGTLTNGPTWSGESHPGGHGSLLFGTTSYVSVGDINLGSAITLACSARFDNIAGYRTLIVKRNTTTSETSWALRKGQTDPFPVTDGADDELTFYQYNAGFRIYHTINADLVAGQWYHIAVTYDGATDPKIYKDGVLLSGGWGSGFAGPAAIIENDTSASIGALTDGTEGNVGPLDDIRLYNLALSSTKVAALYHASRLGYPNELNRYQMWIGDAVAAAGSMLVHPGMYGGMKAMDGRIRA